MNPRAAETEVFRIRIPKPLIKKVRAIAEVEKRTAAYMIRELVEQGLIRRAELETQR